MIHGAAGALALLLLGTTTACCIFERRDALVTGGIGGDRSARPVENRVLGNWLECEECLEGELAAVVAAGDGIVPRLEAIAKRGLSPARRELLRLQLEERYAERVDFGREHPHLAPKQAQEAWVTHHLETRDRTHRARAVRALGAIGSDASRKALRNLLPDTRHEGLAEEIRRALGGA